MYCLLTAQCGSLFFNNPIIAFPAQVAPFIGDSVEYLNDAWESGKRILVEGANATMLDLDFGTYPFVTSSNPSIGGVASGLGLAPTKFEAIIGVVCSAPRSGLPDPTPEKLLGA